jgi:hypothetical protein
MERIRDLTQHYSCKYFREVTKENLENKIEYVEKGMQKIL